MVIPTADSPLDSGDIAGVMQMPLGSALLRTYLPSDACGFCEAISG